MKDFITCDLCDAHPDCVQVVTGLHWYSFGQRKRFCGLVETVKCFEDNSRVKECLNHAGTAKVLVVDGGHSLRCALLGDMIAETAFHHGWEGIIIAGACRDVEALAQLDIGILALGCVPIKSTRRDEGQHNIPLSIGGVQIHPGTFIYADANGIITSDVDLLGS